MVTRQLDFNAKCLPQNAAAHESTKVLLSGLGRITHTHSDIQFMNGLYQMLLYKAYTQCREIFHCFLRVSNPSMSVYGLLSTTSPNSDHIVTRGHAPIKSVLVPKSSSSLLYIANLDLLRLLRFRYHHPPWLCSEQTSYPAFMAMRLRSLRDR